MAKALHNAYGEMENELRRINYIQYVFHCDSDRETCMEMIEKVRRQNVYPVSALRSVKAEVSIVYQEDPNVFCVNEDIGKHVLIKHTEHTQIKTCFIKKYTHCTGCGRLWVTDGIWKTMFPHCMFRVEVCL